MRASGRRQAVQIGNVRSTDAEATTTHSQIADVTAAGRVWGGPDDQGRRGHGFGLQRQVPVRDRCAGGLVVNDTMFAHSALYEHELEVLFAGGVRALFVIRRWNPRP